MPAIADVERVADRLAAVVGRSHVKRADDLDGLDPGMHAHNLDAGLAVLPGSTAEVAAVLRIAAEERLTVVPQGGRTGLVGGSVSESGQLIVMLTRLDHIGAVDPVSRTLTVGAGVPLQRAEEAAAVHGLSVGIDLAARGSATIGGMISTNAGGIQAFRYGVMRQRVLGLEAVLADGSVLDVTTAVTKASSGYDLKQLFIGAEGTLGIITAAVLRLFPLPTATATAWLAVPSPAAGVELLSFMKGKLGEQISAFELMQRTIIDFLVANVPGHGEPMRQPHGWYVLVEISGQGAPGSLDDPFAEALSEAMGQGLVDDAVICSSVAQAKRYWKMREDMAEAQKNTGVSIKHDVSVPVSKIAEFISRCDAALRAAYPGIRPCAFGHVGDGNMHYNPMQPAGADGRAFAAERSRVNRIVHDMVVELGGSISAEHGIGRLRLDENEHYKSTVELDLMRTVKRALDPGDIMNPGKTVKI